MHGRPSDDASGDWAGLMYDRFAAELYRYALMILASPDGAADVVQEVFVTILRSGRQHIAYDKAYLLRAVRNRCYTVLRRRRREAPYAADASLLDTIAAADDDRDERLAVEQAIRVLPPEQREALHLKVFCGMTFQEIADMTEESINTIASRYRYAIEKLRVQLGAAVGQHDAR